MKRFCFILPLLLLSYLFYLSLKVNVQKRYRLKYAVVTGATGGIASKLIETLQKDTQVIAVARNPGELQKIAAKHPQRIIPFVFDFSSDLDQFATKFDSFLVEKQIKREEIGLVFSNAGYGDYQKFEDSDYCYKEKFLRVNVDSHVMIADYFIKLFLKRKERSGLVLTASMASYLPMKGMGMYHTAKATLSALGNALYAEYR